MYPHIWEFAFTLSFFEEQCVLVVYVAAAGDIAHPSSQITVISSTTLFKCTMQLFCGRRVFFWLACMREAPGANYAESFPWL